MSHVSWMYILHTENDPTVLYVGRAKDPQKRCAEHQAGGVRTTAKGCAKAGIDSSRLRMDVLGSFGDPEWPTAEGDVIQWWQTRGQARWNFPHAFTAEENRRGREALARSGHPNLASGRESQKRAGYPNLKRALEANREAGFPSIEANRRRGYPNLTKAWEVVRQKGNPGAIKGHEVSRARGHPELRKATHIRWHVNRGQSDPACPLCQMGGGA